MINNMNMMDVIMVIKFKRIRSVKFQTSFKFLLSIFTKHCLALFPKASQSFFKLSQIFYLILFVFSQALNFAKTLNGFSANAFKSFLSSNSLKH